MHSSKIEDLMNILALDISTTHIGYTVFNRETEVVEDIGCIDLSKLEDFNSKVDAAVKACQQVCLDKNVKVLVVEEFAKQFTGGMSSADVIIKLAVFNGIITYMLYKLNNLESKRLNVRHARSLLGIKIPKGTTGNKKKELILKVVQNSCTDDRLRKTTKTGKPHVSTFDMADSWVIGKAWLRENPL